MKVLVADPVVPWGVAESLTVAVPIAVEELIVRPIILLYEYPALTAFGRIWSASGTAVFLFFVASCNFKRV